MAGRMRAFGRIAWHVGVGTSAALMLVGILFWLRSYLIFDWVTYGSGAQPYGLRTSTGRLEIERGFFTTGVPGFHGNSNWIHAGGHDAWSYAEWRRSVRVLPSIGAVTLKEFRCLGVQVSEMSLVPRSVSIKIPFSYLTFLAAILPALWLRGFIRRRRLGRGRFPVQAAGETPQGAKGAG